ncbi:MAG TPA: hypothetical protein VGU23_07155 [Acidobacteriaceae bacterium]|nr:hypothetical protein [Acidobacteriaceae bacterium]
MRPANHPLSRAHIGLCRSFADEFAFFWNRALELRAGGIGSVEETRRELDAEGTADGFLATAPPATTQPASSW